MTKKTEITLDDLTSALKTVYGQKTEPVVQLFRHWVKINLDVAEATPEWHQEAEDAFLKNYHAAKPLERADALGLLSAYGKHFFETATNEQQAALEIALGYPPLENEIRKEGFSTRELLQALKTLEVYIGPAPEHMLIAVFEWLGHRWLPAPIANIQELIALYRSEPAMKSEERARAILKVFGMRFLNTNKLEDMQKPKKVSGARG